MQKRPAVAPLQRFYARAAVQALAALNIETRKNRTDSTNFRLKLGETTIYEVFACLVYF